MNFFFFFLINKLIETTYVSDKITSNTLLGQPPRETGWKGNERLAMLKNQVTQSCLGEFEKERKTVWKGKT